MSIMIRYVALLRGINVGGNKMIKMPELSRIFTSLGLKNVKTYIQSGNVLFESSKSDPTGLTKHIEKGIYQALGFEVPVVLRTITEIEAIVRLDPFKKLKSAADVKFYVTFLVDSPMSKPKVPLVAPQKDCAIIQVGDREVFSASYLMPDGRYGISMGLIEKEFGKSMTTRNWNTVLKILALAEKGVE